jgi:hypothetical protein
VLTITIERIEARESLVLLLNRADYELRLMLEVGAHADDAITAAEVARRKQMRHEVLRPASFLASGRWKEMRFAALRPLV